MYEEDLRITEQLVNEFASEVVSEGTPAARRKKRVIRAADLFCGAGGFSTGLLTAAAALDVDVELVVVNHWDVAIETHKTNHPGVRHHNADLEHVKPLDVVPGGVLDFLIAAPSCTFYSPARGGKPVYDQQRMDPWHVVRWLTDLRVKAVLVENVSGIQNWTACNPRTGKPVKSRKGEYFRAWIAAFKSIGYSVEYKVLRCADYSDATTRERFFLIARADKKPVAPVWPEPTHSETGETSLFGKSQRWRCAADIIDWSRPGKSIFTRRKPLVQKTVSRLLEGGKRNCWPAPHLEALQALIDGRNPQLLLTARQARELSETHGIPIIMSTGEGGVARGVDKPLPAITTGGKGGATPHFAQALIMGVGSQNAARSVADPCPTITTGGASSPKRPGNARPQVVVPVVVSKHGGPGNNARSVEAPLFAMDTKGAGAIASAVIVNKCGSQGGRSTRGVDEPLPTATTAGAGFVATPAVRRAAIVAPYYGSGSGETAQSAEQPLPAQTVKARFGVASPALVRAGHGDDRHTPAGRVVDANNPLPSVTGSNEIGIASPCILPVTHHDASNRSRPVSQPVPTITGANRGELALAQPQVVEGDEEMYYVEVLYRMLHHTELAMATSFPEGYVFKGNATQITKQIGNAVPVGTATALCYAVLTRILGIAPPIDQTGDRLRLN